MINRIGKIIFNIKEKRKFKYCGSIFNYFGRYFCGHKYITIGNNVCIGKYAWISACELCEKLPQLEISNGVSIGRFSHIYVTGKLVIEDYALIAEKVYISDNLHGFEDVKTPIIKQPIRQLKEVTIGSGAWIGENVCIIGASVGKNSIVGANSVVTRDIPDYCVAVGAPARVIKRFDFKISKWVKVPNDK